MLKSLMSGRAFTASELAHVAGVTPQTASSHLAKLAKGSLISAAKQGRHRYHRLASARIARMLESLMTVAADTDKPAFRTGPADAHMRLARTCYDHLAGWVGVSLANAMAAKGWIEIGDDFALVTPKGMHRLAQIGIDSEPGASGSRAKPQCRPCLDWSERKPHIAGRLGAALCSHGLDEGWVRRRPGSRALDVAPAGWKALRVLFDIEKPTGPV
jgi:hypothetical protein